MKKHTITPREVRKVSRLKRHKHHHIIHKLHAKHKISYKTLFYMKEYGPKSHVTSVIVKESLKILVIASLLSSLGGMNIKAVEGKLVAFVPLVVLLPALANMIGSFGTIAASKFTTMLYLGKVRGKWWRSKEVSELIATLFVIAVISAIYIGVMAYAVSFLKGFEFSLFRLFEVLFISLVAAATLVGAIILISITGGLWIFRKKEDPNNFLIPIATSVGDFGSLLLLSVLVTLLF